MTECYATLPALDYEGEMADVVAMANDILSGMYQLSIYHAVKEVQFGATKIHKNDFFALSGDDILSVKDSLEAVTLDTINLIARKQEWNVMTLFYGKNISPEYITLLAEKINAQGYDFELATVATEESAYDITLAFE
jgi:dihydroxyacetone kinase-like predicted kinase